MIDSLARQKISAEDELSNMHALNKEDAKPKLLSSHVHETTRKDKAVDQIDDSELPQHGAVGPSMWNAFVHFFASFLSFIFLFLF